MQEKGMLGKLSSMLMGAGFKGDYAYLHENSFQYKMRYGLRPPGQPMKGAAFRREESETCELVFVFPHNGYCEIDYNIYNGTIRDRLQNLKRKIIGSFDENMNPKDSQAQEIYSILFQAEESFMKRLRFLKWLYETGRISDELQPQKT